MTGDRRTSLGGKLIEHVEAAQAIIDELGLDQTGYLVERALTTPAPFTGHTWTRTSKHSASRREIVDGCGAIRLQQ